MILICAWCKEFKGEKEPLADTTLTHGICKPCADKLKANFKMSAVLDKGKIQAIIKASAGRTNL